MYKTPEARSPLFVQIPHSLRVRLDAARGEGWGRKSLAGVVTASLLAGVDIVYPKEPAKVSRVVKGPQLKLPLRGKRHTAKRHGAKRGRK